MARVLRLADGAVQTVLPAFGRRFVRDEKLRLTRTARPSLFERYAHEWTQQPT